MTKYISQPWHLPALMATMNLISLTSSLMFEGRLRHNALKFLILYTATIPAARRGDLNPFMQILCLPA